MPRKESQPPDKVCPDCGRDVDHDSDYCPSCGHLFLAPRDTTCRNHDKRHGAAVCIICGEAICTECIREHARRIYCREHERVHVEQDWALAYESSDINDATLARSVLEEAGFDVVVRDFTPIGYLWDGAGDSSLSRTLLRKRAKVFVPIPQYLEAVHTIEDWDEGEKTV